MKTFNELINVLLSKEWDLILIRDDNNTLITNSNNYRNCYHFKNPIQLTYIKPLKQCRYQKIFESSDMIEFKAYKLD